MHTETDRQTDRQTDMCSRDLHRVDGRYGIHQVVCLVNDDHIVLHSHPDCLTSGGMEEGVVGKNYKLD